MNDELGLTFLDHSCIPLQYTHIQKHILGILIEHEYELVLLRMNVAQQVLTKSCHIRRDCECPSIIIMLERDLRVCLKVPVQTLLSIPGNGLPDGGPKLQGWDTGKPKYRYFGVKSVFQLPVFFPVNTGIKLKAESVLDLFFKANHSFPAA